MSITVSEIPEILLVPGHYQQIDASLAGGGDDVKRVLIVGMKTQYGTAEVGQVVQVSSLSQARKLFGEGSSAAIMTKHFLELNKTEQLFVLPIAENSAGSKAIKQVAFTANSSEAGVFSRLIGGVKIQIQVIKNDSAAALATKFIAAVNSFVDLSVEASIDPNNNACVFLTSRVKGEVGNFTGVNHVPYTTDPAGISITLATVLGTGNPEIKTALSALGSVRYHFWISDLVDLTSINAFADELTDRYSATRQIGGRLFLPLSGVVGDASTSGSMIAQADRINCPHVILISRGNNFHTPAVWASRFAAIASRALADDPATNTQGLLIPDLSSTDNWNNDNRQRLLLAGIATWRADPTGRVLVERLVTSYKLSPSGDRDTSYLDVQVVETVDAIRSKINTTAAKRFQKWKLSATSENFGPGSRVMTPEIWKGFLIEMYQKYFILKKQWCQNLSGYKSSIIVEMVADNKNKLKYQHRPILVGPLYITAGLIQFQ